jgi:cyclohexa-1,5-dienecarbonyl-CoA hydratase
VSCLRVERAHGDAVVRLILARPKANVMDAEMIAAIRDELAALADNSSVKLIVFEGEGANFSFGASVPEHLPGKVDAMLTSFHALFVQLEELGIPTAAAVRGHCLGGAAELVLWCGFVAGTPNTRIGFPEVSLGVFPPVAAAALRWRTGGAHATRMIVTGAPATAEEAHRIGLVDLVCEDPRVAIDEWYSTHLGGLSALAVRYAWRASRMPMLRAVREELPVLERLYLDDLMNREDPIEGLHAFLEKRQPTWRDR